jgi:hypothetical protein
LVPGRPLFWAAVNELLYLFYDDANRAAADPGRILVIAERKWPAVARSTGP